jgi:hypothetical protein
MLIKPLPFFLLLPVFLFITGTNQKLFYFEYKTANNKVTKEMPRLNQSISQADVPPWSPPLNIKDV